MATTAPVTTKPTAIKSQSVSVAAAVAATSRAAELETACGWKGSFNHGQHQQQEPTKHSASSSSMSLDSVPLPPPSMERGDDESSFDPERYSSGEVSTVSESVERDGIRALHAALTRTERTQMDAFDPTMLVRHFRAEKGDKAKAIAQIKTTLQWRLDFGVDALVECFDVQGTARDTPAHGELRQILAAENVAAKVYVRGYDANGRALMYMTPARENTNHELNNMRHLVFNLEKAIQCTKHKSMQVQTSKWNRTTVQDEKGVMSSSNVSSTSSSSSSSSGASVPPPQPQLLLPLEKINLLIDYDGFKLKNAPPMSTTKYTLEILQKHYPERMQHAYLLNPPFVFRAFWALIKAFVDPITKAKIVFCTMPSHLTSNVTDLHKLEPRAYGSNAGIQEFDSHEYLRLLFHMSFNEE